MSLFTDLLADFQAERRFLCVLEPYDVDAEAVVTLYFSSHGFTSEPGDTPANRHYEARIASAYEFSRSLFQAGKLSGRSIPGNGTTTLNNSDGALDYLENYAWGGRRARIYMGGPGFALADYGLIFDGTIEAAPELSDDLVTFSLRDNQYVFDREIQTAKFLGTGTTEGQSDLKDRVKPRAYGVVRNVTPVYLGPDSGRHLFSVGDGPIIGVLRVLDRGIALVHTTGTPTPGFYSVNLATGLITLGGGYNGPVTADVVGVMYLSTTSSSTVSLGTGTKTFTVPSGLELAAGMKVRAALTTDRAGYWMDGTITSYSGTTLVINATANLGGGSYSAWTIAPWGTVAGVLKAIADGFGVTAMDDAALNALDAAQPATIGWWLPEGGNGLAIMDAIADGASCFYGFDRAGNFEAGRIDAPGTPVAAYDETQTLEVTRQRTDEPSHEVSVRYRRNWTPLDLDSLAGGTTDADRTFLTQEWRQAIDSDAAVLAAWPLSQKIEVDSVFDDEAAASAEASRLLGMFGVRRGYYRALLKTQPLATETSSSIELTHPRYGLTTGKALVVIDLDEDMTSYEVEIGGWG